MSEKVEVDFTPDIEIPPKIQDIIAQTIAHVTINIKIMKQAADTEMTHIQRIINKNSYHNTKSSEGDNITQDNKSIQMQVKKTGIKFTLQRS